MKYLISILSCAVMMGCQTQVLQNKFKIESLDFTLVDYLKADYLKNNGNSHSSVSKFDVRRDNEYVGLAVKLNKMYSIDEKSPLHSTFFGSGSSVEPGRDGTNDTVTDLKIMIDSFDVTDDFTGENDVSDRYVPSVCFNCNPYDTFKSFKLKNVRFDEAFRNTESYCVSPYIVNPDSFGAQIDKSVNNGGLDFTYPVFFIMEKKKFVKMIRQSRAGLFVKLKVNSAFCSLKIDL